MPKREPKAWITMNGVHIPIFDGQTKEQAIKSHLDKINSNKKSSKEPDKVEKKKSTDKEVIREYKNASSGKAIDESKSKTVNKSDAGSSKAEENHKKESKPADKVPTKKSIPGKPDFDRKPDYDLSEAVAEKADNSIKQHLDKDGKLTEERQQLHNKIVEDYFRDKKPYAEGEEKWAKFTGGGPASGKGGFVKNIGDYYSSNDNPITVDPDEIKKLLLKADTGEDSLDDKTTGFYHEESSLLAKHIYDIAIKNNYPILFDGTATGIGSLAKKLKLASDHGYKTDMCFMTASANTVLQSSLDRFAKTGRIVNLGFVLSAHTKAQSAVPEILKMCDNAKVYNREGSTITLMATGGKGKTLNIRDKGKYDAFFKPGAYELETGALNKYNQEVNRIKKAQPWKNKKG